MKLLHTADWHLGKRLGDYSRLPEQEAVLEEICEISEQEQVDAVLIAGDLFDTFHPGNDAAELLYRTVHRLSNQGQTAVVAIAGNHDSPHRIESTELLARSCGIIFQGHPETQVPEFSTPGGIKLTRSSPGFLEISLPRVSYPLRLLSTPYANEVTLRRHLGTKKNEALRELLYEHWQNLSLQYCDRAGVNVLMAHLFVAQDSTQVPEEPDDEKPVLHVGGISALGPDVFPDSVQYVALGHLHRFHQVGEIPCPIVYSGTPVAYSFAEAEQQKYVSLVEIEPGQPARSEKREIRRGKQLVRGRFSDVDQALDWLRSSPGTFVELTLISDQYIDSRTKKALYEAHDGIVSIIPEIIRSDSEDDNHSKIDLQASIPTLFARYFEHRRGQTPPEDLLDLLREVVEAEQNTN